MPAKKPKVRIRCYRQGFGDCFLLSFETGKKRQCQVLIDCGLWPSGEEHKKTMRSIAEDIAKETGGEIDVLVATHEHWDHLSGFNQARDIFEEKLKVRNVWLAWTEKLSDPLAKKLRDEQEKKKKAAKRAREKLKKMKGSPGFSDASEAALHQLDSLLGFFGATDAQGGVEGAMKFIREEWGSPERSFHNPGALLDLPGVDGVRVYVLGPPRSPEQLRRESSSKEGALYELFFGLTLEDSLLAALGALDDDVAQFRNLDEIGKPFDASHRHPVDLEAEDPAANLTKDLPGFFNRHYADESWRRIDTDWLHASSALALRMDKGINNTSLVLAFELPDGRVLLFPGDAQLGNWESWHDETNVWPSRKAGGKKITARDLLDRTVFYKVGHHGSHNATAQNLGLELMNDPGLTAFVPISHEMALANKWDRIPLTGLVRRLRERAQDRVWFAVEYDKKGKDFTNPQSAALKKIASEDKTKLWFDFSF